MTSEPDQTGTVDPAPDDPADQPAPATPSEEESSRRDPLRGSRTSGTWAAVLLLTVVLILLAIFILQNTQRVEVSFLGWSGHPPLSAALLIAAAGGAVLVASAGALRILQLRRRVKRERKAAA
jgi:uncharacterized integral membrane protein